MVNVDFKLIDDILKKYDYDKGNTPDKVINFYDKVI